MQQSSRVAIYRDESVSNLSVARFSEDLRKLLRDSVDVLPISPRDIHRSDLWKQGTILLIVPGGRGSAFQSNLGHEGNAKISSFIEEGAAYLGVCAGAYYASHRITFEKGTEFQILGQGGLKVFAGEASGSIRELTMPYRMDRLETSTIVKLVLAENSLNAHLFYWGGPRLIPFNAGEEDQVIARFAQVQADNIAVVCCQHGDGKALLSSVHPEISGEFFDEQRKFFVDGEMDKVRQDVALLKQCEGERLEFFRKLLLDLKLEPWLRSSRRSPG